MASGPDAESQFHAHEFFGRNSALEDYLLFIRSSSAPKISWSVFILLSDFYPLKSKTVIVAELDGVPYLDNEELKDAAIAGEAAIAFRVYKSLRTYSSWALEYFSMHN